MKGEEESGEEGGRLVRTMPSGWAAERGRGGGGVGGGGVGGGGVGGLGGGRLVDGGLVPWMSTAACARRAARLWRGATRLAWARLLPPAPFPSERPGARRGWHTGAAGPAIFSPPDVSTCAPLDSGMPSAGTSAAPTGLGSGRRRASTRHSVAGVGGSVGLIGGSGPPSSRRAGGVLASTRKRAWARAPVARVDSPVGLPEARWRAARVARPNGGARPPRWQRGCAHGPSGGGAAA